MYPEEDVRPMREELEAVGAKSLRSPEDVDQAFQNQQGTALVVVNSVCGCAAGGARPGVSAALQNKVIPDQIYTVFAGVDREATDKARTYFEDYPPSSPAVALLKDGKVAYMMQRHDIEGKYPDQIADELAQAFDQNCGTAGPSIPTDQFEKLEFVQVCGSELAAKARRRAEEA